MTDELAIAEHLRQARLRIRSAARAHCDRGHADSLVSRFCIGK
jgi:hypothetical protein